MWASTRLAVASRWPCLHGRSHRPNQSSTSRARLEHALRSRVHGRCALGIKDGPCHVSRDGITLYDQALWLEQQAGNCPASARRLPTPSACWGAAPPQHRWRFHSFHRSAKPITQGSGRSSQRQALPTAPWRRTVFLRTLLWDALCGLAGGPAGGSTMAGESLLPHRPVTPVGLCSMGGCSLLRRTDIAAETSQILITPFRPRNLP